MIGFVKELIRTLFPPQDDIQIERAHRALGPKPTETNSPRSIIVRFTNYAVKEAVLCQALLLKQVIFQGKTIYLDPDDSLEVQKKSACLRDIIKQIKEKRVQAKCRFLAQLRINLEGGVKIFPTLLDTVPT